MPTQSFLISHVAEGATVSVDCAGCGTDARQETGMYAVADVGPVLLGWFTHCAVCGDHGWRCRPCGLLVDVDAKAVHGHLLRNHSTG